DGSATHDWLQKARNEANRDAVELVVVLLPADTSAHWFHDHILEADAICLVGPGRIPFIGENRNPSFQLSISVFGEVQRPHLDALDKLGAVIRGRTVYESAVQTRFGGDRQ
ncbi:DNA N-6-adenine-methyltransferase, partial [Haloferax sp. Atlit-105R]|uniref:DNA N-6-adenine-methyltransferase n=1 Tax=Haloferax sp. Atlit-105R TaxID=2282133 RepID=UPI000EF21880